MDGMAYTAMVRAALKHVGAPYIWQAKGGFIWTPAGLAPLPFVGTTEAFDCSGLVTTALAESGGVDWRATKNAQALFDSCTVGAPSSDCFGALAFFGATPHTVHHVGIALGNGLLCEASGGDETTTNLIEAQKRNAKVRVDLMGRSDFLGYFLLPDSALVQ